MNTRPRRERIPNGACWVVKIVAENQDVDDWEWVVTQMYIGNGWWECQTYAEDYLDPPVYGRFKRSWLLTQTDIANGWE